MPNVSVQVVKDVQKSLVDHGFPSLPADREAVLKGQIEEVSSDTHAVHKIMSEFSKLFLLCDLIMVSPQNPVFSISS
jgi:hypothetical protein